MYVCMYVKESIGRTDRFMAVASSHISEDEFLVSKETVVLRRWERSKQKFAFIKRVDKG